jgi:signal transduction histidine kinase
VGISLRSSIRYGEKRSRFASIVTHELRTPLTTFRMYSEMLARGMVPEERRGEYLATLERESARLATLVENVLAYSRLEEGRARLRRESTTASTLLERVTPELRRRATEAGMELSIEDRLGGEVPVETDIEAVEQILVNLVDNACKYGRSREGRGLELQVHAGRSALELRLQDHGRGVPPGAARAIFHAFDRGHRDATDPHPGIGLGLALARGLARDLGGDLVLEEGQAGSGARFLLTVPRVP